ncbi:MAG: DUF29 domain-containing protein [Cyanobacteria bacterium]|nr:DUF29 domain-containing protein [Cyanobacteriota bacterium]MDW8202225.1 DUF29 domain-containing protein [Cyanobacteriota bacterium SKYGB_h_bin112]
MTTNPAYLETLREDDRLFACVVQPFWGDNKLVMALLLQEFKGKVDLIYTVAQLKAHNFSNLDLENPVEEIESMSRSQKHAVSSYLMRLVLNSNCWEAEQDTCSRGWKLEVRNLRLQIQEELEVSPSLKFF